MAGKVISKANLAHVQTMHDTTTKLGAQCGGAAKRLALKAADMGVFDLLDRLRQAMYANVSMAEAQDYDYYPHLEDVYPDAGYCIIEIGEIYWQASYLVAQDGGVSLAARDTWVQVVEVWQPVAPGMKAGALPGGGDGYALASVKALGDRTLELRVAWGRDGQGEAFDPARTDFDLENFPAPPVLYYHGYTAANKPAPRPIVIGKTIKRENRADGHYLTAKLNDKPEADTVWNAALARKAVVSPGTVSHLIRKAADATLTYWPIAEISAWDWDGSRARKQAHPGSLAFPVLKSLYLEAGIPVPSILNDSPTEAPGDGAGSATHTDPQMVGEVIAAEVAAGLLALRRKDTSR